MKPFTKIVSVILALIGILLLARVFLEIHVGVWSVSIWVGYFEIPMWVSIVGFIVTSIFSIGLWKESK